MPSSIELKLRSYEKEVLQSITDKGIDETMRKYHIKTRDRFIMWLHRHQDGFKPHFLDGMNGGQKAAFIKKNRQLLLDLINIAGKDTVIDTFNISQETYQNLIHSREDTMYTWQQSHKVLEKWSNREAIHIIKELLTAVSDLTSRVASLEKEIEKHDLRLQFNDEQSRAISSNQKLLTANMEQFGQNTAEILSKVLLQPLLAQATQPGIEKMQPLNKPDLSLSHLIVECERRQGNG